MTVKMDPDKPRVLVIEDDPDMQKLYQTTLDAAGFEVEGAFSGSEAYKRLDAKEYAAVLSDLRLPDTEGHEIIAKITEKGLDPVTFLMSAHADTKTAVGWFKLGIEDYFLKPFSTDELEIKIKRALKRRRMENENRRLKEELARLGVEPPPPKPAEPSKPVEPKRTASPGRRPAPAPRPAPPIMRTLLGAVARAMSASAEEVRTQAEKLVKMLSSTDPVSAPAGRVLRAAEGCTGLLDRVQAYAEAERFRFEPCDIRRLVGISLLSVGDELDNAGIEVIKELGEDLPKVAIDESRIGESVLAVLENAALAMPGGGTLRIRASKDGGIKGFKSLRLGPEAEEKLMLEISDDGNGIAEEGLSRVFEPFYTTRPGSRGLGLTLARENVRRHGGTISIKSKGTGKGTTVSIELPVNGPNS